METVKSKVRMLPVFNMAGTEFYVDIRLNEFREVNAPWNRISMDEIRESIAGEACAIAFDQQTKNIYEGIVDPANIPGHVKLVVVPPLYKLDPAGLAQKLDLPEDTFTVKRKQHEKFIIKANKHKRGRTI